MKEVSLTRGAVALVDDDDYETLKALSWYLAKNGYAARRVCPHGAKTGRPRKGDVSPRGGSYIELMHRRLMGLEPGDRRHVHHVNGERLDNRRTNLEVVAAVPHFRRHMATGGVHFYKQTSRWHAQASAYGVKHHLGYFATEAEARAVAEAFQRGADAR